MPVFAARLVAASAYGGNAASADTAGLVAISSEGGDVPAPAAVALRGRPFPFREGRRRLDPVLLTLFAAVATAPAAAGGPISLRGRVGLERDTRLLVHELGAIGPRRNRGGRLLAWLLLTTAAR